MKICLCIDPSNSRLWHQHLIERLGKQTGAAIHTHWSREHPHPDHIVRFFGFEQGNYHTGKSHGAMRMERRLVEAMAPPARDEDFDLVIDLVGDGTAPTAQRTMTLLFNGYPGEPALVTSIMQHGMPQIALRNGAGKIIGTAMPSGELAAGVSGSMDQSYARVVTLLCAVLNNPERWVQSLIEKRADYPSARSLRIATTKSILRGSLKQIYYRLFRPSHWRIGWRWVTNEDVFSRRSLDGESWNILKDQDNHFYADPVPWVHNGRHFLFFEDLDHNTEKGIISVVEFDEAGKPGAVKPCLEEEYHLSYPFLIRHRGETYMIPETSENGDVALYKTDSFPFGWKRCCTLMKNIDAADVTVTQHQGRWWIFCVTRDGAGGYSDCLSIFHAPDLFGPWQPHAQNPVLIDRATARPAGNFVKREGRLYRPAQDCTGSYGERLWLVEVTELSPERYTQNPQTSLGPDANWPGRKLHMLNRAGRLEVVDGAILRPRNEVLKWLVNALQRPVTNGVTRPPSVRRPSAQLARVANRR